VAVPAGLPTNTPTGVAGRGIRHHVLLV
jgi:hypothetical protein